MSQPEPTATRRSSHRIRNIAFVVLGLCVLVGLIGALTNGNSGQASPTPAARAAEVAAATAVPASPATLAPAPTRTPRPTATPRPTDTPEPTPTPIPTVAPQVLRGTGQRVIKAQIPAGLAVFDMRHTGSSNFAIKVLDASGRTLALLVNEIGSFNGSTAINIPAYDTYALNVDADGAWTLTYRQPVPDAQIAHPPLQLKGKGPAVTQFLQLDGLTAFTLTHTGSSNFAVTLLAPNGRPVDLIVNEIGPFNGSQAAGVRPGPYLLKIDADGSWTISIE